VALIAALGAVQAAAQRAGRSGGRRGGFSRGFLGPEFHPGFGGPRVGFIGPRFGFVRARIVVGPGFRATPAVVGMGTASLVKNSCSSSLRRMAPQSAGKPVIV